MTETVLFEMKAQRIKAGYEYIIKSGAATYTMRRIDPCLPARIGEEHSQRNLRQALDILEEFYNEIYYTVN